MRAASISRWALVTAVVFVAAALARLGLVLLSRGGPSGNFGYDAGVYYAAADALIHGRLPYRDFVLLHPPALMLALTPFAALGRLTSDHTGFIAANTTFAVIGATNAALVVQAARRLGVSRAAALLGGLFYALWYGAISAEISARLEPLGTCAFLIGLVVLLPPERAGPRRTVAAGVAFGVAMSVKIWWIVPVLVVAVGLMRRRSTRRQAAWLGAGALLALVAMDGPFFALAPGPMWRMVVADQLGRHPGNANPLRRLDELSTLHAAFPSMSTGARMVCLAGVLALLAVVVVATWRAGRGRLIIAIALAQGVVLLAAPTYFSYYAGYPAAPMALVVALAAHRSSTRPARLRLAFAGALVAIVAVLTGYAEFGRPVTLIQPFPSVLADDVSHVRCVMADSPMALIELDALSRGLADGCHNWVDVSGRTYDVDAPPDAHFVTRRGNQKWQADLRRYLLSGNATVVIRGSTGIDSATRRLIDQLPVLARDDGVTVYRVPPR